MVMLARKSQKYRDYPPTEIVRTGTVDTHHRKDAARLAYERGADALHALVVSGAGGFTRAMMEADKYLREHPDEPCVRASANREQSTVKLRFAGGLVLTFTGGVSEARERISRKVTAAHRRLLLLKFLFVNGPSSITEIAVGVGLPAERCRELIRTCEWFILIPGRRKIDMRYAVSAVGKGRYRKDTDRTVRKGRVVA